MSDDSTHDLALPSTVAEGQGIDGVRALDGIRSLSDIALGLPSLGDANKAFWVELTEPEINAIFFAAGMFKAETDEVQRRYPDGPDASGAMQIWKHYGPTLWNLSERLRSFDERECPVSEGERRKAQPATDSQEKP